jgi:hypothetical protein
LEPRKLNDLYYIHNRLWYLCLREENLSFYNNYITKVVCRRARVIFMYLCHLCLFPHSGIQNFLTVWVTWQVSYKELITLCHRGSSPVFGGVRVAQLLSFLLCFCFVCRRPVSCVPNVASVSRLSILGCPFAFLQRLLWTVDFKYKYTKITIHVIVEA